jgi:isocitrate/isopropylmalate dehydrogenase
MRTCRIAVIPGDGIGPEVVQEAIRVLETAGNKYGLAFQWEHFHIDIAPSGNINPEREYPSMLEHLGHGEAARSIETAIQAVFTDPIFHTQDLGGKATTKEVGRAVVAALPPVYNGRRR